MVDGYSPGALASLGIGMDELINIRPGIIKVSVSCYGPNGRSPTAQAGSRWRKP